MAVIGLVAYRRTLTQASEVIVGLEWATPTALDRRFGEAPPDWRSTRVMWSEPWIDPLPEWHTDREPF